MSNDDMAAVGDSEKLIVTAVDKTDSLRRLFHMLIEKFRNIGVTVKIVIAGAWNTAQKIGVFFGINPIPVFPAEIPHKTAVGVAAAVFQHRIPVTQ